MPQAASKHSAPEEFGASGESDGGARRVGSAIGAGFISQNRNRMSATNCASSDVFVANPIAELMIAKK